MKKVVLIAGMAVILAACGNDADVVGKVNDRAVSATEFESYLNYKRIPLDDKARYQKELANYLEREGIADVILKEGKLDEERVNVEINEFKKQMVISRYMEKLLSEKVNEEAVRNFYASNSERYQSKKAHVAHILLRTNPKMSEEERQALLTRAHEVYSLASSSEEFAALAEKYSDDKLSAKNGGDIGWVQEGAIDPAFTKAAFELKQGEVSEPVATPFGFHVIKVIEEAQRVSQPFEAVRGNIRYELRQNAKQAEMERLQSGIKVEMSEVADAKE